MTQAPDDPRFPAERAQTILSLLQQHGRVASAALAAQFGVSEDSIRRDLRELAAQGLCQRVYGGAVRVAVPPAPFAQRQQQDVAGKAGLAAAVCALLQPGQSVFLDAGTTNLAVAQYLPEGMALNVISNSPQIAIAASARAGVQVQLIGGRLQPHAGCVVGAEAVDQLQRHRFDVCVPGACAVDTRTGVWANDAEEAALKRLALTLSARVIVAATADKLGTQAGCHVAALADIDDLVVDHVVAVTQLQPFVDAGIALHRAQP